VSREVIEAAETAPAAAATGGAMATATGAAPADGVGAPAGPREVGNGGAEASGAAAALAAYEATFTAAAAARSSEPSRLRALREEAFDSFARLGFPTTRQEDWRFTNVGPLGRTVFAAPAESAIEAAGLAPWLFDAMPHLVFVDGRFAPELSATEGLPTALRAGSLRQAIAVGDPAAELLGVHSDVTTQPFTALNTALFTDGALVAVPRGLEVAQPLQLLFVSTGAAVDGIAPASFPRVLVVAEENSSIVLVERYVTLGASGEQAGEAFNCPVTEIVAGPSARVDHYRLAQESAATWHVGLQQLWCDRNAVVTSYSIVTGGGLVRQDVRAALDGEGVEATLNGLYLTRGRQHVDHHMFIEHRKPHCNSHELFKGILEDRSRAVFNGLIHVWPGAQKTDAKQTNRNLLLSSEALVNTNPQLRIFADDVKCTHGSTVGQLDEEAVFYLRSRGIGEEAAKSLLTYAFARDVVDRITAEPVRRELEELLLARLPKGDVVRQAI
jgi:Fe-S cluster assembly protein SufD